MNKKYEIEFLKSDREIKELVTKFGGQPVWLHDAEWPISKEQNEPMSFICQIKIDKEIFPDSKAEMAYIFMTDDGEDQDYDTCEYDGGENAVILQPGDNKVVLTESIKEGPSLIEEELIVKLSKGFDVDFISDDKTMELTEEEHDNYYCNIQGNKIGGTPAFIQMDEFPDKVNQWNLLLQLHAETTHFELNFGDDGTAYAFINEDGTIAKIMWQCG